MVFPTWQSSALSLFLGCLALTASQADEETLPSFASFIAQHGRVYTPGTQEYDLRRALFDERIAAVKVQNGKPERLWTAGVNHLSDRTEQELSQLRGWRGFAHKQHSSSGRAAQISRRRAGLFLGQSVENMIPDSISWGNLSAIKAETNQWACGSCWALAAATVLNAAAEKAGVPRTFSGQDLVNCVPNPHHCGGTGGCEGATVELAMDYVVRSGIRPDWEAPYYGAAGRCDAGFGDGSSFLEAQETLESKTAVGVHQAPAGSPGRELGMQFWERLPENEQKPLMAALVQHGPVAISAAASGWNEYSSGIFNSCDVNAIIDHAVTLFGYGSDAETRVPFWEIKNSWGLFWGEGGNIRLLRTDQASCGIDNQPEVGTGCDGGPSAVRVCGMCGILYDSVAVQMR
mmetsp:Transcript_48793/g.85946  ORF Transcript_48793/g.85946 Transcript_48793/m.85946 type:complete len:403 (-) Transcript_48793:95-1303(-)